MRTKVEDCEAVTLIREPGGWACSEEVAWTWTPCHFGGVRPWLLCPACGARAAKLYRTWKHGGLNCRPCLDLAYASQSESRLTRGLRKARSLHERVGGGANLLDQFPQKPPRMHWRTYIRLQHQFDRVVFTALSPLLDRMERIIGLTAARRGPKAPAEVSPTPDGSSQEEVGLLAHPREYRAFLLATPGAARNQDGRRDPTP